MNHLAWILSGLLFSLCAATQISKRQALAPDYDDRSNLNQGGEVFDSDPLLYLNLGGSPGVDFPMLRKIPKTSFSCKSVKASGYYADMETNCQVFHLCEGGRKMSFLCPNGTIFRQSRLTCDWWYKVDCGTSQEFYESSAEQLRLDRATATRSNRQRPLNLEDKPNPIIRSRSNSLESQEVAETGSLIINRAKSLKSNFHINVQNTTQEVSSPKPTYELRKPRPASTPSYGMKKNIYVPTIPPLESTSKSRTTAFASTTTTPSSEFPTSTFESTTFRNFEQRSSEREALEGSHSSWFNTPTTLPPVTEASISELVNNLQPLRRSDVSRNDKRQSRPGLLEIPLSASPQTLHSLATYFAADNKTREALGKMVPQETVALMNTIIREQKQLNPSSVDSFNPDLRQLAKVFSKALSDYLHDPEGFKRTLDSVHPTQPPVSDNLLLDEEKDEVLDFSDAPLTKAPRASTTDAPQTTTYPSTTPFSPTTVRRNDIATQVNEIQDQPQARRVPDGIFVTPGDFSSPSQDSRAYLPSTPDAANLVDPIPTPTSNPINPESIPFDPPLYYPHSRDYVEIGFQPQRAPTGRSFVETGPGFDYPQPLYDPGQFVPSDLNSLSILNIETRNPSPTQAPVSVSVHIPKGVDHRVTIFSSPQNLIGPQPPSAPSHNRPMISKLLFPLPAESLISEGTASFATSFRNSKSRQLFENSVEGISKIVSEKIPAPSTPAATVEPITEFIPTTTTIASTEVPTTEFATTPYPTAGATDYPEFGLRARKVDDSSDESKLVLLLVKNGATTPGPATPFISKTMLIEALLKSQSNKEGVPKTGVSYVDAVSTSPSSPKTEKSPEATTYRSAKHADILRKIEQEIKKREQITTEPLPQARSLVDPAEGKEHSRRSSLHNSDSRALDILKSLYSLATRWG